MKSQDKDNELDEILIEFRDVIIRQVVDIYKTGDTNIKHDKTLKQSILSLKKRWQNEAFLKGQKFGIESTMRLHNIPKRVIQLTNQTKEEKK